jgi:hypothetical protein
MSRWDEGKLKRGKLNLSPHSQWNDSPWPPSSLISRTSSLWDSLLLSFLSLIAVLLIAPRTAHATHEGEGLFALSLEEVLDINVTVTERFVSSKEGVYVLTSHELIRLYSQPEQNEVLTKEVSGAILQEQRGFPVLLRGNYLGTFKDQRSALRFIKQISGNDLRVDLYVGRSTVWFEGGRYPVLFDIQYGDDLETTAVASAGTEADQLLTASKTEVLP